MLFTNKGKRGFTQKEKLEHYKELANGGGKIKVDSKFSESEQRAYARGQADARIEQKRIFARKNSSPEKQLEYAEKQAKYWGDRVKSGKFGNDENGQKQQRRAEKQSNYWNFKVRAAQLNFNNKGGK